MSNVTDIATKRTTWDVISFRRWSDEQISRRLSLLEAIEAGELDLSEVPGPILQLAFPEEGGFQPDTYPPHNRALVWAEARRRELV